MFKDFEDLFSCLHVHNAKYLIVGGYAVSFHGQPRATKDLDIFVKADLENAEAIYAALSAFGAPLEDISIPDLANPLLFIRFGREPVAIDILPKIDGVDFDAAWERRVEAVIDRTRGLTAFFISREDLLSSKLAAGRIRDLADAEELQRAAKSAEVKH